MVCIDVRNTAQPFFTFQAHAKISKKDREASCATTMSFSTRIPGMLATASTDKTVKVWDVNDLVNGEEEGAPRCVAYKSMNVGKLLTLQFSRDDPFMLATGGDKGMVAIWESDELDHIRNHFESRVVSKSETYSSLRHEEDDEAQKSELDVVAATINHPVPAQDDSWMDDNSGVAGAVESGEGKKKKKSKKDKK